MNNPKPGKFPLPQKGEIRVAPIGAIPQLLRDFAVAPGPGAAAHTVVAGDTGVMHMATAMRTPVVTLFGPTVRAFGFAPYRAPATILERDLPCRPCSAQGGSACPLGHHRCLSDIAPADVVDALARWST